MEGTGSYRAGLTAFLDAAGERVVEVCRPKRPAQRGGAKPISLTPYAWFCLREVTAFCWSVVTAPSVVTVGVFVACDRRGCVRWEDAWCSR